MLLWCPSFLHCSVSRSLGASSDSSVFPSVSTPLPLPVALSMPPPRYLNLAFNFARPQYWRHGWWQKTMPWTTLLPRW